MIKIRGLLQEKEKYLTLLGISSFFWVLFYPLASSSFPDGLFYTVLIALFFILTTFYIFLTRIKFREIGIGVLISSIVFLYALLIPLKPVSSIDLNTYIYRARVATEFGENPYIAPYNDFTQDVHFETLQNHWGEKPAFYGPVFTSFGIGVSYLSFNSLVTSIYLYKILFALLTLISGWMIYKISESKRAFALFCFNPLIIFEVVINAHNDILLATLLLASLYYLKGKSYIVSGVSYTASVLTKYMTFVFAPFYAVYLWKNLDSRKFVELTKVVSISVLFAVVMFIPFWEGIEIFSRFFEYPSVLAPKLSSPGIVTLSLIFGYEVSVVLSRMIFFAFFASLLASVSKEKTYKFSQLVRHLTIIFLSFLFLFLTWLMPWYAITLVALTSLCIGFSKLKRYEYLIILTAVWGALQYITLR